MIDFDGFGVQRAGDFAPAFAQDTGNILRAGGEHVV